MVMERRRLTVLAVMLALALVPAAADGAPITVGTTADLADATPNDATCGNGNNGGSTCSLRAAIQTANGSGNPGLDVITVPANASPYKLTIAGTGEESAATGDLDLTSDITITGGGAAGTTVDGNALDRVFDGRAGTIDISGLTITNGKPPDDGVSGTDRGNGGGIDALGTAVVTVHDAAITANKLGANGEGGGAATRDDAALTLTRVALTGNSSLNGGFGDCGAVAEENNGTATGGVRIEASTISENTHSFGGAVCENGGGKVDVVDSTVSGNTTAGNFSLDVGGGLLEDGSGILTITRSTISGNTAGIGAGVMEDGGGTIVIDRSTISGNHAKARIGATPAANNGSGAGLGQDGTGKVTITNSTISGNQADLSGGGLHLAGAPTQPIEVTNTTIDANTAASGGALSIAGGTVRPGNSIVAGGCVASGGAITSAGHNLDNGTSCALAGAGDKANASPQLGPLAFNGGPTRTEALQDGSPAIDAADPALCPAVDQRGVGRPFGPACDIGAFEGGSPLVVVPPGSKTPTETPSADLAAARRPTCLSIAGVVRDQKTNAPGGGRVILQTRQVDDPANPLRTSVKLTGRGTIRSVTFKVNGRTVKASTASAAAGSTKALPVAVTFLRLGSKAKRNKVTVTVVLGSGKKVTLTQFMIVLKCSAPATRCTRLADGKSMRCTSRTPLGGRRVRITASRTTTEVARGSATVKKGKYTTVLRSTVPLAAGTYAYKHVVTTKKPRQRFYMIRKVTVT